MKIQIVADLHIDFSENHSHCCKELLPLEGCDTLLIAGDFCTLDYFRRAKFIEILMDRWKTVLCIPGNHDFYGRSATDPFLHHAHERIESSSSEFIYLNNETYDIGNIRFICTCLWSPVRDNILAVQRNLNDYHAIDGYTIDINNSLNRESIEFLECALMSCPTDKRIIVMTHHLPLFYLIDKPFQVSSLNEAFANNLSGLIDRYADKIMFWVYGHSHQFRYDSLLGVNFIRNPLGYLCHNEHRSFRYDYCIDL